ncbi:GNAT family protein [Bacillus sp. REN3]|uniref:GNAT family N-acetyltransferase n=1 Tax=Bacillus sp. REN3 TaxID=2802440 RepID=UPI001AEE29CC|nr:GNAT family protein [Bacillus sp. REN3]
MGKLILEGSVVSLVPMEMNQLAQLWEAADSADIWEFTSSVIDKKDTMQLTMEKALEEREKGTQVPFSVLDKRTGKFIGSTRYMDISPIHRTLEIGWTWYHPDYWRTAVNTEAKYLLLQHAFEKMGMNRVQFCTDSRNIRSQKAIIRIGAKKEGVLRKHRVISNGFVRDTMIFSIIKEEWPSVKSMLQGKMNRFQQT